MEGYLDLSYESNRLFDLIQRTSRLSQKSMHEKISVDKWSQNRTKRLDVSYENTDLNNFAYFLAKN